MLIILGSRTVLMQVRKLQATAGGTFVVTLPKDWVEKLKLKKGDLVETEFDEGSLVITPANLPYTAESRSLDIDELKDKRFLGLSITASYIQGHDVTKIFSSSGKMQPHHKQWVREALEGLMGVEVSEDYANHVVLLNLIDPTKFKLRESLEKLSGAALAVLRDAILALEKSDNTLARDAYYRGNESARLYRLIMRLAFQAATNRKLREEMAIPDISTVIVMTIATRELGRIAYYAMWIGQHVAELTVKPEQNFISLIQRMTRVTADMQVQALKALLSRDLVSANSVFQKMPQVRQLYQSGFTLPTKYQEGDAYHLTLILRDLRAIAGYAVALADDAVLGMFVE